MMRITRPTLHIKPAKRLPNWVQATVSVTLAATLAGGCAPLVATAPFPARADTVMPGDLLGPFDGRVVDGQAGKPIPGALVQVSWAFETGSGLVAPAGGSVRTVATDNDGRYVVPRLTDLPSARSRVVGVTLVIYQRGYVAYRSDRLFDDVAGGGRVRTDFSQHNNVARLDRWTGTMSHVKHVRFVGGSGTLKRALGSEVIEASLELTSGRPQALPAAAEPQGPPLDISGLLTVDELRAVTGYGGAFTTEKLGDIATTASYDSLHFKATNKPETYDAALRVWRLAPLSAEARYGKLLAEVPHAESRDEIGDRSLRGYDGRIVAVAALDRAHGLVIELTCGLDLCRDADQATSLLRRVLARSDRIAESRQPAADSQQAEPETKKPEEPKKPAEEEKPFQLKRPELKR
jgi:hypothetical protein